MSVSVSMTVSVRISLSDSVPSFVSVSLLMSVSLSLSSFQTRNNNLLFQEYLMTIGLALSPWKQNQKSI